MICKFLFAFIITNGLILLGDSASCEIKNLYKIKRSLQVEQSDPSKVEFQLALKDCVYYKTAGQDIPSQIDSWTISRDGKLTIYKKRFKYGEVKLGFTVENPLDASQKQESIFTLNIKHQFNPTNIFVALDGTNMNPEGELASQVHIPLEENSEAIDLYIGGYNYDLHDTFTFRMLVPCDNCFIQIRQKTSSTLYSPPPELSCGDIARHNDRIIQTGNVSAQLYYPCNLTIIYPGDELSWWSAILTYKPSPNYFGNDSFKFEIRCSHSLQATVTMLVNVLANPCKNGGKCRGPAEDPHCTSLQRTVRFSFYNYTCDCRRGYSGYMCSIPPDQCSSSPCSPPFACHTEVDGSYKCVCPKTAISCHLPTSWIAALIIISVLLVLFGFVYLLIRKSRIVSDSYLQSFSSEILLLDRRSSDTSLLQEQGQKTTR